MMSTVERTRLVGEAWYVHVHNASANRRWEKFADGTYADLQRPTVQASGLRRTRRIRQIIRATEDACAVPGLVVLERGQLRERAGGPAVGRDVPSVRVVLAGVDGRRPGNGWERRCAGYGRREPGVVAGGAEKGNGRSSAGRRGTRAVAVSVPRVKWPDERTTAARVRVLAESN